MGKYRVVFLQPALEDLEEIVLYIAKDSRESVFEMHDKIVSSANRLETFPKLGILMKDKKMNESGFRMIVIDNYLLFYKIYDDEINILRVLHGKRNYPRLFDEQG